jgi:hypothetical protein
MPLDADLAALAAMPEAKDFERALIVGDKTAAAMAGRDWPYRGYRMTIFSPSEEAPVERDVFGARLPYPVAAALSRAEVVSIMAPTFKRMSSATASLSPARIRIRTMRSPHGPSRRSTSARTPA